MKLSRLFVQTLREAPNDAEVTSHQLLVRAGFLVKVASGIYSYSPLMWRVLLKITAIVREEMNRASAQEVLLPILQPATVWQESGRWDVYGKELFRLKDRHDRDMALAPTGEEVITALAKTGLKSYRNLPANLYQISQKYRDEPRPRFGLLRGREFIMKDAYSFHATQADLEGEYAVMGDAYERIFQRCGLETKKVRSDSGAIGGAVSHEYMVLTGYQVGDQQSGENDVIYCDQCSYAANVERAESHLPEAEVTGPWETEQDIPTPKARSIEDLAAFGIPAKTILKSLLYVMNESTPATRKQVMVLIRGDLEVEETKLKNALARQFEGGCLELRLATESELSALNEGAGKGFFGPVDLPSSIRVLADASVLGLKRFALATNVVDSHRVGADWNRTLPKPTEVDDLRKAQAGDGCPECGAELRQTRGIEVGNIFQLGTKYSQAMSATFMDADGIEKPYIMGCYGIGVTRLAAAAIELYHDKDGMVWPASIAPYEVIIVPANVGDETQRTLAERLYKEAQEAGLEVLLDDRDERAGVKFKDADLLGIPVRVTVGKKAGDGVVEVKTRSTGQVQDLPADGALITALRTLLTTPFSAAKEPVLS
jgi:prolyl-tRNA synthetase